MYNAQVLPIMIASPSDVQDERDLVREIVNNWNYTDSFKSNLVLMPVGWETHSSPELGIAPQEQINERLVDRCDILVGIFWTKIGSPTESEESGTVEEIRRFIDAGKPAMLYFSSKPAAPETFDAEQWNAREEFRNWCTPKGLYQPFSSLDELRAKFSQQLRLCLNENSYISGLVERFANISADIESGLQTVTFPEESVRLLKGAVEGNGIVTVRNYLGGSSVSGGSVSIETSGSGRKDARWRNAVERLSEYGLIEERSFGSGVYFVTNEGYESLDRLAERAD